MMAMPQQERNGRDYQYRQACDAPFPRSPPALRDASTLDTTDETDPYTTVFSPILNNQVHTPPTVQKDRHQYRSTHFAINYLPSLPTKTTDLHMPVHFASRSSSAPAENRPISSQPPMTASRSFGLKLDLSTLQPWIKAGVPQPMSSTPSFLGETSKSYAAATTTALTTITTPLVISPPESVYSLAKTVDAAYNKASSLLTHAMSLTNSSLEEQAFVIRYHAVAQHVFDQGLRMTESQWCALFPYEQCDDQTATSAQYPSPPSLLHATCASPHTVMLTPNIQENLGKQPEESFETPTKPPDQASTRTQSSSYSSFSSFFVSSRPLSPTTPSLPSTPSRSPMMVPLVTARGDNVETGLVQPAPSMGFEIESVQSSIFAHNCQGYTASTQPPPLHQQSIQTLESPVVPCAATSFDTVISATTDRSSAIKTLLPAKLKAMRENKQQLRESDHNRDPQGQQYGMPLGQYQQDCLAAPLFATPKTQLQVHNQQQCNHWQQQEAEIGHLEATTATTRKEEQKGKPTSSEEVGRAADRMTSQLSEAQWNRVKERSTELYHKAIKSFEISVEAHRVSQESHFQYDKLVRHWKVLGDARKD
ncbi:MAG: hypothetical protein J3R72DRAFT_510974 [Linnemannia gamsii]|nr:MAG: hypothetical protein J3R72DRAFT_510974 [Linnemannia gamsii]